MSWPNPAMTITSPISSRLRLLRRRLIPFVSLFFCASLSGQLPSDVAEHERNLAQLAAQREPSAEHEERREAARRRNAAASATRRQVDASLFGKVEALEEGHGEKRQEKKRKYIYSMCMYLATKMQSRKNRRRRVRGFR